MVIQVDIPLGSWWFGNNIYCSGEAEEQKYVLRVTDQAMTIRRKTEQAYPGLFVVISRDSVSNGQVCILSCSIARELNFESRLPPT